MAKQINQMRYGIRVSAVLLIWIGVIVFITLTALERTSENEQIPGMLAWLYETGGKWFASGIFAGSGGLLALASLIVIRKQ